MRELLRRERVEYILDVNCSFEIVLIDKTWIKLIEKR